MRTQIEEFRIGKDATNINNRFRFTYYKRGSGIVNIGGQDFYLKLTQSLLDQINYVTYGAKFTASTGTSISKQIYEKLKNTNNKNFIS